MLHYEIVDPRTLELLNKLMEIDVFKSLRLVGGTSLALQIGHRHSVDLDLFGELDLDEIGLRKSIKHLGTVIQLKKSQNINLFLINEIKIDLVNYPFPWLEESIIDNNIRLAGIKDIAAMKIGAIIGRGTKKDFIDIYYLLRYFCLKEILSLYKHKYNDASEILALKSLSYFEDADKDEDCVMMKPIIWEDVKTAIKKEINNYLD